MPCDQGHPEALHTRRAWPPSSPPPEPSAAAPPGLRLDRRPMPSTTTHTPFVPRPQAIATSRPRPALAPAIASVAVLAGLVLSHPAPLAGQADPNAPTDDQVTAAAAAIERLLAQNRAIEAFDIIRPIAEARPDSMQATFSMGMAAIAAGDSAVAAGEDPRKGQAREYYNTAVHAFRDMLVRNPRQARVRLELARSLFQRGNCITPPKNLVKHLLGDDCWAAEQHFLRVLGTDIPPQVALNVRRFIQICRARKRANGSLSLALAPDTNVNTSTSAQTVDIFGLPFQLDDQARAKSGIGLVGAFGTEVQLPMPKPKWIPGTVARLRVGGNVFRREYSGGEFDDYNYSMYAGPRFLGRKGQYSILMQADRRQVNGRPYSRQYGLRTEGVRLVTGKVWAGGSFELSRQTALSTEGPIGNAGLSWNGQMFATYGLTPSLNLRFMGGWGRENTDRLSTRHSNRWIGLMATYDLPFAFTVTAAQQYFLTDFDQRTAFFGSEPPKTKMLFSRLAIHNRKLRIGGFSPSLSFIRERRDANITIYEYQRYRMEGGFVRVF